MTVFFTSLLDRIIQKSTGHSFDVVSIREDGLCQRLNTILDAMLVAKALNATFAFHWSEAETPARDQQTTASIEAVFDADFLKYHRPGNPNLQSPRLDHPLLDASAVASARASGESEGQLLLDRPYDLDTFFSGLGRFPKEAYAPVFDSIGFSLRVREAIAAARSVPIAAGAAAVHIRGGDILHGTHAFHDTYLHKAPSLFEIDAAVLKLLGEGREVWLIGQEPDVQAAMVARHSGVRAFGVTERIPVSLTSVGAVLFDAVILSRMVQIYGGKSGVTRLACRLGEADFTDIGSPAESDHEVLAHEDYFPAKFSDVSKAARAHTLCKVVVAVPPACWTQKHLSLIRAARNIRPANAFLQLVEVCVIARVVGMREGERAARIFLTAPQLEAGVAPDVGFAFLVGGKEFFPFKMTSELLPEAGPATALLSTLGKALTDDSFRTYAFSALDQTDADLAPKSIDAALRERLLFYLNGNVHSWETIAWKT